MQCSKSDIDTISEDSRIYHTMGGLPNANFRKNVHENLILLGAAGANTNYDLKEVITAPSDKEEVSSPKPPASSSGIPRF